MLEELTVRPLVARDAASSGRRPAEHIPSTFGQLTPLLAPHSVAVVGASDREGNLGGAAVGFLRKFGFQGAIWPVNIGRTEVHGLPCFPSIAETPGIPDLAILAVPAEAVAGLVRECGNAGVRAVVVWAGGFAEVGDEGLERQRELSAACKDAGVMLCGPNCIGIINTDIGLTASFSSLLYDHARLIPGAVSLVSQSGGISVNALARAQALGYGFRVTVSVGNEVALGIPDFIHALAQDDGTRVIAVYTEGLSDPEAFVGALAEAKRRGKPVVILKGGATEASGRAALAHTGRMAGVDRMYDAIFRELAAIRVYSSEELIDVSLQLASQRPGQLPAGDRVLISTFGGGSGVICTDQCGYEGLDVPVMGESSRQRIAPLMTPLSSVLNPVDMTPGIMTNAKYRQNMPAALQALAEAPDFDAWLFMAAGFGALAPELVEMLDQVRQSTSKPLLLTWQSMPNGTAEQLANRGIFAFTEHARAARALGHMVRYAANLRHRMDRLDGPPVIFDWQRYADRAEHGVVSEHDVAHLLEAADLPVARGRIAKNPEEAVLAAEQIGYPVAIKGISAAVTHRAAAGLVALNIASADGVVEVEHAFHQRAAELGVTLDGVWVQHMFSGDRELLVTAIRNPEFGVMVGVGVGGGMTEIVDDIAFTRAPISADGAQDLLAQLRTLRHIPSWLSTTQQKSAAEFVARFSALAASAPWAQFTLEVNPVKLGPDSLAAVDGLLLIG